jgi:hypothetical protein
VSIWLSGWLLMLAIQVNFGKPASLTVDLGTAVAMLIWPVFAFAGIVAALANAGADNDRRGGDGG